MFSYQLRPPVPAAARMGGQESEIAVDEVQVQAAEHLAPFQRLDRDGHPLGSVAHHRRIGGAGGRVAQHHHVQTGDLSAQLPRLVQARRPGETAPPPPPRPSPAAPRSTPGPPPARRRRCSPAPWPSRRLPRDSVSTPKMPTRRSPSCRKRWVSNSGLPRASSTLAATMGSRAWRASAFRRAGPSARSASPGVNASSFSRPRPVASRRARRSTSLRSGGGSPGHRFQPGQQRITSVHLDQRPALAATAARQLRRCSWPVGPARPADAPRIRPADWRNTASVTVCPGRQRRAAAAAALRAGTRTSGFGAAGGGAGGVLGAAESRRQPNAPAIRLATTRVRSNIGQILARRRAVQSRAKLASM